MWSEREASRTYVIGGVAALVTLYEIDEIVELDGLYRVMRHAPKIEMDKIEITIETAKALTEATPGYAQIGALVELLSA